MFSFFKSFDPKISGEIDYITLYSRLKANYPEAEIILTDRNYRIPKQPERIIKSAPASRFKPYIEDSNDCDDYVRIFRGWLSEVGFGNLLAMSIKIVVPSKGPHNVIGFLMNDKIIFGEPKLGALAEYKDAEVLRIIA